MMNKGVWYVDLLPKCFTKDSGKIVETYPVDKTMEGIRQGRHLSREKRFLYKYVYIKV